MLYRRIRELREDEDMTQSQVASLLHCSQRVYSNYERGERDIPTEILIILANHYNVSLDYLLGRTDMRQNPNCRPKLNDYLQGAPAIPVPSHRPRQPRQSSGL